MRKLALFVLLIGSMATCTMADSISFIPGFNQGVTVTGNGAGSIGFTFGTGVVQAATPAGDSLNLFPNNPFLIGTGIVMSGSNVFTSNATSLTVGSSSGSAAGQLTGTVDFISIGD